MSAPISVLVVDDQVMVASGLMAVLQTYPDLCPLGVAHSLAGAMEMVPRLKPDVIVLDYRLADGLACSTIGALRELHDAAVLVFSASGDIDAVTRSIANGASGFLLKEQPVDDLVAGIRKVALGQRVIAPALMGPMLDNLVGAKSRIELTPRQAQILQLLAQGVTTNEIAVDLGLSVNTVRNQIQSTIARVGAHSKLEAVSIALRENLILAPTGRR